MSKYTDKEREIFQARLRDVMRNRGWTVKELAGAAMVSRKTAAGWVDGYASPSDVAMFQLAVTLGVSPKAMTSLRGEYLDVVKGHRFDAQVEIHAHLLVSQALYRQLEPLLTRGWNEALRREEVLRKTADQDQETISLEDLSW